MTIIRRANEWVMRGQHTRMEIPENTMFDRIIDGILDFFFMAMILILSVLGTLIIGL